MARRRVLSHFLVQCLLFWAAPVIFLSSVLLRVTGTGGFQQGMLFTVLPILMMLLASSAFGLAAECCLRRRALAVLIQLVMQLGVFVAMGGSTLPLPKNRSDVPGSEGLLAPEKLGATRLASLATPPTPVVEPSVAAIAAQIPADPGGQEPEKISVVLPCLNESTFAIKTARRFCERTPEDVLQEIVVVDDGSSPPLSEKFKEAGIQERCRLRVLTHSKPYGLMIAKQTGGDASSGKYIGFFDCHVAPAKDWYKEIIHLLHASPRRMVVPMIGDIDVDTWDEKVNGALTAKCYIDFNADFWWYDDESDFIPVISGGLVATTRFWWRASGGFDSGMRGWGGENTDQSLRAWLCGGDILRAKTSRVAHMWRVPADTRTLARYRFRGQTDNLARVAAIWFGEFKGKFRQGGLSSSIDVSEPLERNERMKCKPFVHFLHRFRRIFRDGGVLPEKVFKLRSQRSGKCIQRDNGNFELGDCTYSTWFHFANMAPEGFPSNEEEQALLAAMAKKHVDGRAMVTCGNHQARTCAECPQGNGAGWCHRDCTWQFGYCVPAEAWKARKTTPQPPGMKRKRCCSGIRQWNSLDCFDRPEEATGPIAYQCDVTGKLENQQYIFDNSSHIRHTSGRCVSDGSRGHLKMTDCDHTATAWEQVQSFFPEETQLYHNSVARHGLTDDSPDH